MMRTFRIDYYAGPLNDALLKHEYKKFKHRVDAVKCAKSQGYDWYEIMAIALSGGEEDEI